MAEVMRMLENVLFFMHFDFQIVDILLVKQFQILSLEHVMVD